MNHEIPECVSDISYHTTAAVCASFYRERSGTVFYRPVIHIVTGSVCKLRR